MAAFKQNEKTKQWFFIIDVGYDIILGKRRQKTISKDDKGTSKFHTCYIIAESTGMRRGEIMGLRWTDVNLEAGTMTGYFNPTKKGSPCANGKCSNVEHGED